MPRLAFTPVSAESADLTLRPVVLRKQRLDTSPPPILKVVPSPPGRCFPPHLLADGIRQKLTCTVKTGFFVKYTETGDYVFEYNVLRVRVQRSHLSLAVSSPVSCYAAFQSSHHLVIKASLRYMPVMESWNFVTGDLVEDINGNMKGVVLDRAPGVNHTLVLRRQGMEDDCLNILERRLLRVMWRYMEAVRRSHMDRSLQWRVQICAESHASDIWMYCSIGYMLTMIVLNPKYFSSCLFALLS